MQYLDYAVMIFGIVLLVVGYRKNNRNVLVSAALVMLLGGADASSEFVRGWKEGAATAQAAAVKQ